MGKRRVTRFTDANGSLKAEFRDTFERQFIEKAYFVGLPAHWMALEGALHAIDSKEWEELGDLTGAFTDGIYVLSCCLRGVNEAGDPYRRNMARVIRVLDRLVMLVKSKGVDPFTPGLLPFDVMQYRLQMYRMGAWPMPKEYADDLDRAEAQAREELEREWDAQMLDWGMPEEMLTPEHDRHGHSKTPSGWFCLRETS
jgi:hypothetical protein